MHLDISSFEQNYSPNIRYEDFIDGLYHQIKIVITRETTYRQLVSVSSNLFALLDSNPFDIGGRVFIIQREGEKLFQIRRDGSKVQLWAFENTQVPIEILLENYRAGIR